MKLCFLILSISALTSRALNTNKRISRPAIRSQYIEPYFKVPSLKNLMQTTNIPYFQYQMQPQMISEDNRGDMYYRRLPIRQYNMYRTIQNTPKRKSHLGQNYYQNNRKQDFGFGNRFRQRGRTTTATPKKYGPRPMAVFN